MLSSAEAELRPIVIDMIHQDNKFIGWSLYITDIAFFWSDEINTACAGHGFIFFNPDFWNQLSEAKQKTVIAHEICHLILDHINRGEGYDHESYNIAGDYVINNYLAEEGFEVTGLFGDIEILYDKKYSGQTTEQVYHAVHQDRKKNSKLVQCSGALSKDQIEDLVKDVLEQAEEDGKTFSEQVDANQESVENNASNVAVAWGSDEGTTSRLLEALKRVTIQEASYAKIFEPYLTDPLSGGKRTFLRPSRRPTSGGLRLKGRNQKQGKLNRLTHLVYALDVSGSISHQDATQFLESAHTIKEVLNPKKMTVILWDTNIVFEKTYSDIEKLGKINIRAGGGTCLKPVYKRVKELNPEALVIFTDFAVDIPPKPKWETIWFATSGVYDKYLQAVSYGTVYKIPKDNQ